MEYPQLHVRSLSQPTRGIRDTRGACARQTCNMEGETRYASAIAHHLAHCVAWRAAARCQESRCEANASRSRTPNNTAETTKVRCNSTYQRILSLGVAPAFMKMRRRCMEDMATIE